jgi:hypothetical protein
VSVKLDYDTYIEVSEDLLNPIVGEGLDVDTLKRLYLSKLVYLKNLRRQCFFDINKTSATFSSTDLAHITGAIKYTNSHLRELILKSVREALDNISSSSLAS